VLIFDIIFKKKSDENYLSLRKGRDIILKTKLIDYYLIYTFNRCANISVFIITNSIVMTIIVISVW